MDEISELLGLMLEDFGRVSVFTDDPDAPRIVHCMDSRKDRVQHGAYPAVSTGWPTLPIRLVMRDCGTLS